MAINLGQLKKAQNIKILAIAVISVIISIIPLKFTKGLFLKNIKLAGDIKERSQFINQGSNTASLKNTTIPQIEQLRGAIGSLEAKFSANAGEIVADINRFAESANVNLIGISPQDKLEIKIPDSKDIYAELPIEVRLECGFYELLAFLKKIENAGRIILVNEVKIRANPRNTWEHDVALSLALPLGLIPAKNSEGL
ncbi:MAG: type 4a pilus biogenesis protein PilO [Candidatus Omnitrophota bacterium]|nr:type 4a pilus biogenesis protein PilO [Candidatus Omnitrophota bacterium]